MLFWTSAVLVLAQDTIRASFESSPVCYGTQTQFINKSYVPTSLGGVNYLWKFGDGTTSTDQFGKHTYKLSDTLTTQNFNVTLVITSKTNPPDIDSVTNTTTVYGLPQVFFNWKVINHGSTQEVQVDSISIDNDNFTYTYTLGGVLKSNNKKPVFSGNDLKPYLDGKDHTFTLFMRSPDGCENLYLATFNYNPLGIEDLIQQNVQLFPNPTTGILNIPQVVENIEILSMDGRILISDQQTASVNVSEFPAGIYLARIKTGDRIFLQQIIKQ